MTDDIVTRLRATERAIWDGDDAEERRAFIKMVADEIERLRETVQDFLMQAGQDAYEIKRLREDIEQRAKLMSQIVELLVPFSMLMSKHEQELLVKAVRGD